MSDLRTELQALQAGDGVAEAQATVATVTTVTFVDGLVPHGDGSKRPPKLHHKKSKTGCQRCRTRRVKCDEMHPICENCERHEAICIYDRDRSPMQVEIRARNPPRGDGYISDASRATSSTNTAIPDVSESKSRRLLELKLLHHYNTKTCQTLLVSGDPTAEDVWVREVPNLAFENEALLYSMYTLSALHMAESKPQNAEIIDTHRRYLSLAICEHKKDITDLNEGNFDAVCMTASILRINAFAMLRDRVLVPYAPPVQWLDMTRGSMNIFKAAWQWIGNDGASIASRLTRRMPLVFDEEAKFAESNRQGLLHLLHRSEEDIAAEAWHPDVQEAYESTISYLGCIWIAMKAHELPADICRRLVLFPFLIRSRFIDLVKQQQPRALAVLGHYFALLARFRSVWWIGDTGPKEVHALSAALSPKWQDLMRWPLQLLEEDTLHA